MNITEYLEELTDQNWHTLRELIELERGLINDPQKQSRVQDAYECAIAYLEWDSQDREGGKHSLFEFITRRIY